jgi:hypothetical protein
MGFIGGQIRTLQKFGHLANFAIWLNVAVIFMTMSEAAHSLPNFAATALGEPSDWGSAPISHTAWVRLMLSKRILKEFYTWIRVSEVAS